MYHIFLPIPLLMELGCFQVLAVVNSDSVNIWVLGYFWTMLYSGYIPRSGIAGSNGSSVFRF